jgi:hypothetical protein
MSRLRFEIQPEDGRVSLPTYYTATLKFTQILRELDSAISGKGGGMVNWYVADLSKNGTLTLEVESQLKEPPKGKQKRQIRDTSSAVATSFIAGFENIEVHGISPPFLSEYGLEKLQDMMLLLLHKNGAKGFITTYVDDRRSVAVTQKSAKTLRDLLPTKRTEEASVEGTLETISVHGGKKVIIYESLTHKGVTCNFPKSAGIAEITFPLGRKVVVSGLVSLNVKNEPIKVQVHDVSDVRVLGSGKTLPTTEQLTGSDPDFTGGLSTDEYLERIRRG